jgi:hypothetical protein
MNRAASSTAGVGAITVNTVIAGSSVIGITTAHSCRADVISTDIAIRAEGIVWCAVTRTTRTGIDFSAGYQVITGGSVIGMSTGSRPITLIIGTHIAVIGTRGARGVKTAVGRLLTGVALSVRTGITRMERAASSTADIGTIAENSVIAGIVVIGMSTYSSPITLIICTYITIIGT